MSAIRVLELRSVRGTGGGPEKTILMGAARSNREQFAVTVCYIRDARDAVFAIDTKAAGLPVDYVEVIERHSLDTSVLPALRRIVRERRIDIVHAHEYKTDLLAWLLHKTEDVIPLSTAHGWTGHSTRERYVYYPLDKQILRAFPTVIAVSEEIRQALIRAGVAPGAVETVLNGIDHRAFRRHRSAEPDIRASFGFAAGDVVIGSVGRLEPQKRFDLLLDAVAELRTAYPRIKLVIAGDGSLRAALDAQIARLNLGGTCQLLGHVNDVGRVHHAFDLFVQASDYEGTPNSVLEAMALETAVVATAAGGTAQLVRHGIDGLIVDPGDSRSLVAAIERTLADPQAAATRVASARRRVETDLSFDTRMATVEAIYSRLCAGRPDAGARVLVART